ncbi:DUF4097 family beta strand repeat-containing protein [Dyadobacter sp. CY323]|uniref:DUF4097 family beta strand repeat-containing protein n=1 Tax=Dyadobacter sp. CY323 TaxID=2907302 RepID=UPI001F348633|nr:DUF4097 family beta strand repeat-containing protein [Dyadobacter sp. CY323]MCE6987535.1 DUF4097 family beta strand repeat-containing protein [Dyadobacter sp. CY323]
MKKVLLMSIGGLLCLAELQAQGLEYKAKLANTKDKKVTIEMAASDVKIEGYAGDEVIIQASKNFEAPPERAKGLKPLYNTGVDNSGIGLSVTPENGGLRIEKVIRKEAKYTIRVPKQVSVLFQETNWQGGSKLNISGMDGDLEIKTNGADINLTNVTGPVVANSTSGNVNVIFSGLDQSKPTAISSISGEIDVTLPANVKSDMKLRSINGEMYTDFDLGVKSSKGGLSRVGGMSNIEGTTNGGGVEVQLNTISSNIYIRKK